MRRSALALALIGLVSACASSTSQPPAPQSPSPPQAGSEQTAWAGPVEVQVTLDELSGQTARFTVAMDNHERDLTADPAKSAIVVVAGSKWPAGSWQVAESTGHHLSGTLSFPAPSGAPPAGNVELTLGKSEGGLPEPVTLTWQR